MDEEARLSHDEQYFAAVAEFASALVYTKAMRGAREHGGRLESKPVQAEIWDEWADMGSYLFTLLNVQIPKVRMLLDDLDLARIEGRMVDVARYTKMARNVLQYGNIDGPEERQ